MLEETFEKSQYKQDELIEILKKNTMKKKETNKETFLNINNSSSLDTNLRIEGNQEQSKRNGKNLFKTTASSVVSKGVTFTVNEDGTVVADGDSTGASFILGEVTLKAGTYTFSGGPTSGSGTSQRLTIYNVTSDSTVLSIIYGKNTYTHTFEQEASVRLVYVVPDGTSVNNEKVSAQIEEGEVATEFEQYGVMPSTKFPSELELVKDNIKIIQCNSNFLKKQEVTETVNGITGKILNDGSIVLNGTTEYATYVQIVGELQIGRYDTGQNFKKYILPRGNYKFLCKTAGQASDNNISAFVRNSVSASEFSKVLSRLPESPQKEIEFEVKKKEEYVAYVWINSGITLTDFTLKFMLKRSDDNSDYVQNEQKEYNLPVQQEMLKGDFFIKETDGWKEVHTYNKKIFDGSETIGLSNNENSFTYIAADILKETNTSKVPDIYSNCYSACSWNNRNTSDQNNTISCYSTTIGFDKEEFSTTEEFKSKLSEMKESNNPVIVYYKRENPVKLPCTVEQEEALEQLKNIVLFDGVNNFITTGDLALMQLIYFDSFTLDNLTYNAIGDSLTFGYKTSSTRLDSPYPTRIKETLNLKEVFNNGLSGTTVADDRSVMQSFYPMSADERLQNYQKADIISVMGRYK